MINGVTCYTVDHAPIEAIMWCVVALCSFGADVCRAGQDSRWHIADRLMSKIGMFAILIAKPLFWAPCSGRHVVAAWILCVLLLLLPAFQCLGAAQRAETYSIWEKHHFRWHVMSVAAGLAFNAMIRNEPTLMGDDGGGDVCMNASIAE